MRKTNFSAAIHQARMNEIDRVCYRDALSATQIATEINLSKTHVNMYLAYMQDNGYLAISAAKYGANAYLSTRKFIMVIAADAKVKPPASEKDEFIRTFPHVKPFSDQKALPREFFGSVVDLQPINF